MWAGNLGRVQSREGRVRLENQHFTWRDRMWATVYQEPLLGLREQGHTPVLGRSWAHSAPVHPEQDGGVRRLPDTESLSSALGCLSLWRMGRKGHGQFTLK